MLSARWFHFARLLKTPSVLAVKSVQFFSFHASGLLITGCGPYFTILASKSLSPSMTWRSSKVYNLAEGEFLHGLREGYGRFSNRCENRLVIFHLKDYSTEWAQFGLSENRKLKKTYKLGASISLTHKTHTNTDKSR